MNNGRNKKAGASAKQLVDTSPSVFSLRLPSNLRAVADAYADGTGVSLNGLICIALVDYLGTRGLNLPMKK